MTPDLFCRRLRPGVAKRRRTVPDLFLRSRIWVEREIAEPLKLIAFFRTRIRKCGFAFCVRYFERTRIYERFEIALRIWFRCSEKPIIQPDFRIDCVGRAYP